jgi:hypothetical protein
VGVAVGGIERLIRWNMGVGARMMVIVIIVDEFFGAFEELWGAEVRLFLHWDTLFQSTFNVL